ncbi:MAG: histidine--tRNA ligase [Candidatus Micrarchaeota archaeon]
MKGTPKGMRDILPEDAMLRRQVLELVEKVYRSYGYVPIETPAIEYLSTLKAKGGEEINKQIFIFKDEEVGLRFDLTVPLARVAATNVFTKPFKRYAFAPVWRYEEPQKGRFREFWQADIDIIGTKGMRAEAELLTAARNALVALGFKELRILLNNRKILDALAKKLEIEDKKESVFRLLDKIDKVGKEKVEEELNEVIGSEKTKELLSILTVSGDNKKKLEIIKSISEDGAKELEDILALTNFEIEIDLLLVRGLGYYTGPIFEIKGSENIGSIAGGGRYDNLLAVYGKEDAAVGISLGIERIITLLKEKQIQLKRTYSSVLVANVKPEFYSYAAQIAGKLRENGINVETDLNERNLRKQFDYANSLGISYVIIVGEKEIKENKVTLRNMNLGDEKFLDLGATVSLLKASV